MLTDRYDFPFLQRNLLSLADWRPFPPAADRAAWDGLHASPLHRQRTAALTVRAEALCGQPWPALPATLYMEFARVGNRQNFETPYFQRRQRLSTLVLAECVQHDGRFLDDIIDGLWLMMEETSWSLPAHAERLPGDVLPRQDRETVDLFACETAMVLAEARYLLQAELQAVSPALVERLEQEIERRVIVPVETRDDFWWLSGGNNWSPWCAGNTLGAACYLLADPARLAALAYKMMAVVDRFIGNYGADGGCDEGPNYWSVAAGAMLLLLEHLHARTAGAVSIYDEPLIAAMGRYIVTVHLDDAWFLNFADAPARVDPPRAVVYRYGARIGDPALRNLALLARRHWQADGAEDVTLGQHRNGGDLTHHLREIWWLPADAAPVADTHATHAWLPDLQVLVARESTRAGEGLTLAVKGGHNAENHNHNDVGHVVVMLNGQPCIIDIGVETYTAQTFSARRYELWCIRAAGHNAPVVNGVEQASGHEHRATEVVCTAEGILQQLALNLQDAYPPEAGLRALRRTTTLDADAQRVTIHDAFALQEEIGRLRLTFYTPLPVETIAPGQLRLACAPHPLGMTFDPTQLQATVASVPLEDQQLRGSWGASLTRITLDYPLAPRIGEYTVTFAAE